MKQKIENAIRETLVIGNKQSIHRAADKILLIVAQEQALQQCSVSGSYPVEECIEAAQRYADGKMMDGYPSEYEQMMIDAHNAGQLFLRNKFNIELDYGV